MNNCLCGNTPLKSKVLYNDVRGCAIVCCLHCGQVFNREKDRIDFSMVYSDGGQIKRDSKIQQRFEAFARFNLSDFSNMPDIVSKTFLDFGAGGGETLDFARDLGMIASGYDMDPMTRKFLITRGFPSFENISDIPDKYYDIINLNMVLEHVEDPISLLSILRTKAKQNGLLRINVPNFESRARKVFGKHWPGFCTAQHLWFFSEKTLQRVVEQAGWNVKSLHCDSLGKGINFNGNTTYIGLAERCDPIDSLWLKMLYFAFRTVDKVSNIPGNYLGRCWDEQGDQLTMICSVP